CRRRRQRVVYADAHQAPRLGIGNLAERGVTKVVEMSSRNTRGEGVGVDGIQCDDAAATSDAVGAVGGRAAAEVDIRIARNHTVDVQIVARVEGLEVTGAAADA